MTFTYLPCISRVSPVYLPYISRVSPVYLLTRRAREEAFEKTFTILPLDGGALPKTPNPNPSPNPNPNPNPNPK